MSSMTQLSSLSLTLFSELENCEILIFVLRSRPTERKDQGSHSRQLERQVAITYNLYKICICLLRSQQYRFLRLQTQAKKISCSSDSQKLKASTAHPSCFRYRQSYLSSRSTRRTLRGSFWTHTPASAKSSMILKMKTLWTGELSLLEKTQIENVAG